MPTPVECEIVRNFCDLMYRKSIFDSFVIDASGLVVGTTKEYQDSCERSDEEYLKIIASPEKVSEVVGVCEVRDNIRKLCEQKFV